ncbi:HGGxSTG domain-containing protein [Metabacillus dongyingensis]|uniref:HGGxSTG domain-containing protein n=1 Tax=Metabacillus dongyingensis TaxID=2874282 RepID=UPI003B8ADBE4
MPQFKDLSNELQIKVRQMELKANELGKESPECRELRLELQKEESICGALVNKGETHKACLRPPVSENGRCGLHGGKSLVGEQRTPAQKLSAMKNLRPQAHFVHGLYAEESNFIASLTDQEVEFMTWLDEQVRSKYEVEEGLGDVVLEGLLHDAIMHFRLMNSGTLQKGSKHTAKPLQDLMKTIKEMGWSKRSESVKPKSVLGDMVALLGELQSGTQEKPQIKRIK